MKFSVQSIDPLAIVSDCLVVFVGKKEHGPFLFFPEGNTVDAALSSLVFDLLSQQEFEGAVGKTRILHTHKKIGASHILVIGVGNVKKLTIKDWLDALATAGREVQTIRATRVSILLEKELIDVLGSEKIAEGIVEGISLGTYTFNRYKKMEKKEHVIEEVILVSKEHNKELEYGIGRGELMSKGTIIARDLVNEPSSVTTPTFLSLFAKDIAKTDPCVTCDVLEKKDMERLGMGGILGIAKGSVEDPKLITLRYSPNEVRSNSRLRSNNKTIVLVGKGVTFDSGGLSLKTQEGMETMKIDMAGAAALLGLFSVISQLKPAVTVIGLIPAVENMPSGTAIKPGDVVRAYNGKTIEVISTDAEGRVILADALAWAETFKPDALIDLATLTGACMIALGEDIAGLFTSDKKLGNDLIKSSEKTGEALWEMPMPDSYTELLKSDIADIRNVTHKRYGGAITAALFLKAFVPDGIPWAHIDIAGPSVAEKNAALTPIGGTGFGVRTLLEYLSFFDK